MVFSVFFSSVLFVRMVGRIYTLRVFRSDDTLAGLKMADLVRCTQPNFALQFFYYIAWGMHACR